MGYPYARIKPQRHTGAWASTVYSRVTSRAQRQGWLTVGARTHAKAKWQKRRRDTPAGRCAMTTAGQPRRSSRAEGEGAGGHGACREPAANPAGSLPVPGGGKPWQEGGLCGRKTWQAVCHTPRSARAAVPERGRAGAERGARRTLREAGAHPAPAARAGRRRPAARQHGGQTGEKHPWRHGTARHGPGAPKGFPPPSWTAAGRTGVTPRPLHSPFARSLLLGHGGGAVVGN